jgi:hypothetical protein
MASLQKSQWGNCTEKSIRSSRSPESESSQNRVLVVIYHCQDIPHPLSSMVQQKLHYNLIEFEMPARD